MNELNELFDLLEEVQFRGLANMPHTQFCADMEKQLKALRVEIERLQKVEVQVEQIKAVIKG